MLAYLFHAPPHAAGRIFFHNLVVRISANNITHPTSNPANSDRVSPRTLPTNPNHPLYTAGRIFFHTSINNFALSVTLVNVLRGRLYLR